MADSELVARLTVRVRPGAASNQVVGYADGVLKVRIAAPPVKGRANQELISFLSQLLGIGRGRIAILTGHTRRHKVVAVTGLTTGEVMQRLSVTERGAPSPDGLF